MTMDKTICSLVCLVVFSLPACIAAPVPDEPDGVLVQDGARKTSSDKPRDADAKETKRGLVRNDAGACEGYTLFTPLHSTTTYLVNLKGDVVHTWASDAPPGQSVYLLENGNLLRTEMGGQSETFHGGGMGGRIREFAWDGTVVWEYIYADDEHMQHHDIEPLPNGNVLLIAWERKTAAEAVAAGRDPALITSDDIWPDHIVEIQPERPKGGRIVWEWHVWDHLVQDLDESKDNFGVVAEHPELIDINFPQGTGQISQAEQRRLEALGYAVSPSKPQKRFGHSDWNHTNAVAYNADLDQIALSVHTFSEIWIIDHSTTTEQAAGHTGGRYGKGGDLLYRWGNPQAYRAGTTDDQRLFAQHDVQWIAAGRKGAGHLLVFNNGSRGPERSYSSVDEIVPPIDEKGHYTREVGKPFGPEKATWVYTAENKQDFFSSHISGAQRLSNGNTLVCAGEQGCFFEITPAGKTVWEYLNPFDGVAGRRGPGMRPPGGRMGRDGGPPPMGPGLGGRDQRGPERRRPGGPGMGRDGRRMGPGGRGGPGMRRGGPGGRGGRGPGAGGGVFRVTRLAPDHPGLADRKLSPIKVNVKSERPEP